MGCRVQEALALDPAVGSHGTENPPQPSGHLVGSITREVADGGDNGSPLDSVTSQGSELDSKAGDVGRPAPAVSDGALPNIGDAPPQEGTAQSPVSGDQESMRTSAGPGHLEVWRQTIQELFEVEYS
uniref:Uncharacterized protein n=1 Tax=Hyaloperonospora arabidopsidis (strain Emoy2) TaxID=559515 RepID=M4BBH3_HYAAE